MPRTVNGRAIRDRKGKVARLNSTSKAYRPIVDAAGKQYDGSHGFRNAAGEWQTYVVSAKLKDGKAGQITPDGRKVNRDLGKNDEIEIANLTADKLPQFRGV